MLEFDHEQQKGLFTFYREQQQFQQQLERQKKSKRKEKQERSNKDKIKSSITIHQELQDKAQYEQQPTMFKAHTQEVIRKKKIDYSIGLIKPKDDKKKQQGFEQKPLSMFIFDPKVQKAPQFLIPKSNFGLMSSSIDKLHLQFKELFLSGLDQQLNKQISNSISQARQRRLQIKKQHSKAKEQKSHQKEYMNNYRVCVASLVQSLQKAKHDNSINLPNVNKRNQYIKKLENQGSQKYLVKLSNSLSLQPKKNHRYILNNPQLNHKKSGLNLSHKYKNRIQNQQKRIQLKPSLSKINFQSSYK